MANVSRGSFTLNLGIAQLTGELAEEDRQCAWELYTEMSTRVAVTGNAAAPADFNGELLIESLESLYRFFGEARSIMRRFPVGKIAVVEEHHLGRMISQVMSNVLRPFLERWQVGFRYWWEHESNPRLEPMARQAEFPQIDEFLGDWRDLRSLMRELQEDLVRNYKLVDANSQK